MRNLDLLRWILFPIPESILDPPASSGGGAVFSHASPRVQLVVVLQRLSALVLDRLSAFEWMLDRLSALEWDRRLCLLEWFATELTHQVHVHVRLGVHDAAMVLLGTPRGTRVRNAAPERVYIPSPERNGQNAQSTKPFTFPEPQYFLFRPADLQSVPCPCTI